jgi:hypothetical protein
MEEDLSDESLSYSRLSCRHCHATIIIQCIPMKPYDHYLVNYDDMIADINRPLDHFFCGICGTEGLSMTKVIKVNTFRNLEREDGHISSNSALSKREGL